MKEEGNGGLGMGLSVEMGAEWGKGKKKGGDRGGTRKAAQMEEKGEVEMNGQDAF